MTITFKAGDIDTSSIVTGFTAGSVIFIDSLPSFQENNDNFFWDNTNDRLGLGTATPASRLELNIATADEVGFILQTTDDNTTNNIFEMQNAAGTSLADISTTGFYRGVNFYAPEGTADRSVFIGDLAGTADDGTDNQCIAIGLTALTTNIVGEGNVAIGPKSLLSAIGSRNFGLGFQAGFRLSTGNDNIFIGQNAGLGQSAYNSNGNVMIGSSSGFNIAGGGLSVCIGVDTGKAMTTGDSNIFLGWGAADNLTTGDENIVIGFNVLSQSITADNTMNIANLIFSEGIDGQGTTVSSGFIGIGDIAPSGRLHVTGNATTDVVSIFQGIASQSGNLTEWRDSSDNVLARVEDDGQAEFIKTVYWDAEIDNGDSGATDTISWVAGNKQKSTLTDDVTFTFDPDPQGPCNLVLRLIQDGTGTRLVTWPAEVQWPAGTAPTLSTGAAAEDIVSFYFDGTNYNGAFTLNYS